MDRLIHTPHGDYLLVASTEEPDDAALAALGAVLLEGADALHAEPGAERAGAAEAA